MEVDEKVDKKKKLGEQRKRLQKQLQETEIPSRTWIRCSGKGRKRNGRKTCKRLSRRGTSFCLNIKGCEKLQSSQEKKTISQGRLCVW